MSNTTFDEVQQKVLDMYKEDKDLDTIASTLDIPRYLVESILVSEYRIFFR